MVNLGPRRDVTTYPVAVAAPTSVTEALTMVKPSAALNRMPADLGPKVTSTFLIVTPEKPATLIAGSLPLTSTRTSSMTWLSRVAWIVLVCGASAHRDVDPLAAPAPANTAASVTNVAARSPSIAADANWDGRKPTGAASLLSRWKSGMLEPKAPSVCVRSARTPRTVRFFFLVTPCFVFLLSNTERCYQTDDKPMMSARSPRGNANVLEHRPLHCRLLSPIPYQCHT